MECLLKREPKFILFGFKEKQMWEWDYTIIIDRGEEYAETYV